jgi:hypothetical protein
MKLINEVRTNFEDKGETYANLWSFHASSLRPIQSVGQWVGALLTDTTQRPM